VSLEEKRQRAGNAGESCATHFVQVVDQQRVQADIIYCPFTVASQLQHRLSQLRGEQGEQGPRVAASLASIVRHARQQARGVYCGVHIVFVCGCWG
jgi:hypothetical protein